MSRSVSILSVVVVMTVTVLATVAVAFAVPGEGSNGQAKVTICHKGHEIRVAAPAVQAHINHGDQPPPNGDTELENGDTELENPESACSVEALPEEPSEGATPTLTTDASDATLPDGTISDVATLDVPEGTIGTIEFKLYGPFAADAVIGEDDCVDPDPEADPPVEGNLLFTSEKIVPDDEDPASPGQYTSDPYTAEAAGIYQWVATFTPDSGEDVDSTDDLGCGEATEQSVVDGEAPSTTATEQNMTLAGEIGEDANFTDPATDTTNIEGTNQNDNTILGTDSDDHLFGDSSANVLLSRHGHDFLDGGQGPDRIVGGAQGDYMNAADGKPDDVINGGIGTDYCVVDVGDDVRNCDGNVEKVPLPSKSAAPAEAGN